MAFSVKIVVMFFLCSQYWTTKYGKSTQMPARTCPHRISHRGEHGQADATMQSSQAYAASSLVIPT
ncbi:hypothetical protein U9M48_033215 [Paspalum notatum var. saurae]|uniref:Secreted protein n=1 Tax=Paspalum notatum var. saurae TaxID=547442 RepID=A0AAQ3X635_PASNO